MAVGTGDLRIEVSQDARAGVFIHILSDAPTQFALHGYIAYNAIYEGHPNTQAQ